MSLHSAGEAREQAMRAAMKHGRRRASISGAVILALVSTSCGGDGPSGDDAQSDSSTPDVATLELGTIAGPDDTTGDPVVGGKLVLGLEAEPEGLDPTRYAFSSSGHFVASAVFDPLVTLDDD